MTLEITELHVQISVVSAASSFDQPYLPSLESRESQWLAEAKEEIIKQSVAEVLSRLRRMEVR